MKLIKLLTTMIIILSSAFLYAQTECDPPLITNAPVSLTGSHCDVMVFEFDALSSDVVWSADMGSMSENGQWSYAPSLADVGSQITLTITATDTVNSCESSVDISLIFTNEAPTITTCPTGGDILTESTTFFQVTATDDCDPFIYSIVSQDVGLNAVIDPNTGEISITPDIGLDGVFNIVISVSDGQASSECNFDVHTLPNGIFGVEIGKVGDQNSNYVFPGQKVTVPVTNTTANLIDGYDLLIAFDNSIFNFQNAIQGDDHVSCGWEYFTYRYGAPSDCGSACPSGLLRVVAIGETNNGPYHPTCYSMSEPLFELEFLVTKDRNIECGPSPFSFFWIDCGDNVFSTELGTETHLSQHVFDGNSIDYPPLGQDLQNGTYGFPTYYGSQDECVININKTPIQDIWFHNGYIELDCAIYENFGGDLDLNGFPYEVADIILYSNYFIYGISVFTVNLEGQIAESDVNHDGLLLSIPDFAYMIRVIIGDEIPLPKLVPSQITVQYNNNKLSIKNEAGAALVQLKGNASFELLAENMEIKYAYDANSDITKVLIFSLDGNSFNGEFLQTNNNVLSIELATPDGAMVNSKLLPTETSLSQNYPNPFNPTTTIEFSLSVSDDIKLNVYNINGQQVAEFFGNYDAGIHTIKWDASQLSSGVYFYKLETSNFTDTKKMILLK